MKIKISKLRELSVSELHARGRELKQEALQLRIQKATGQLENKGLLRALRKENAWIETILSERRLGLKVGKQEASGGKTATAQPEKTEVKKPAAKKAPVKKAAAKKKAE